MAKTVKKAETPVKTSETVKTPAAAETVKTPAVSETKPAKAPAKKAAPKTTKTKTAAKKTAKTTKAAPKASTAVKVYVEYQGRQMDMDAILEAVKAAAGKKSAKSLEVYVKPEDGAAYYVVDGKDTGKAII